ncbi:MFS transporter [Cryptosporangium aurantiacum]|uniref:Drug resistance transporter, EmrB/QacA subfamily n=1 Tax=Cryptosporangium aurantiacum TaxID=134849 RepID=A0A1M7Q455_9ACTN|nr:MFS transporter [Cryptosporangium aurantiacum]SHN24968.1 drug resistance transporter, EmrB/QacA subfamily [Cryptosporangium aurantiacum]
MTTAHLDSATGVDPGPATPHNAHHARRWLILGVLGLAQLMVVLDATIVNIALPSAQTALEFSNEDRQWIVTAYALAFGALLPLGGRVGDLIGRKTALLVGLVGFALASAVGGAAEGFGMLVGARAAQGVFGALLAPAVLSLVTTTFTDAKERAKAFGIYGAIAGAGGAIGLLLGGVLTEYLNWRWCLYVNVPIAIAALTGGVLLLHNQRTDGPRHRLDVPGTLTVSAGLFSVVYGFANAETHDWSEGVVWGWLVAGAVLLAAFLVIESRVAHPLIPLRVLFDRTRGGSLIAVLLLGIGMFAVFLFLTYYLQQNLGFSPISSGAAFLPMIGALAVTATLTTSIVLPRVGPRPLVPVGFLLAAAGMLWLTQLEVGSTYAADVLGPLIITGVGIGLGMAPAMSAGTSGVHASDAGVASALVNTAQQIGGSVGTAVLSTIAASAVTDYLVGKNPTAEVVAAATINSYTTTFAWVAGFFVLGAVLSGLLLRSGPLAVDPDAAPAAHM